MSQCLCAAHVSQFHSVTVSQCLVCLPSPSLWLIAGCATGRQQGADARGRGGGPGGAHEGVHSTFGALMKLGVTVDG